MINQEWLKAICNLQLLLCSRAKLPASVKGPLLYRTGGNHLESTGGVFSMQMTLVASEALGTLRHVSLVLFSAEPKVAMTFALFLFS